MKNSMLLDLHMVPATLVKDSGPLNLLSVLVSIATSPDHCVKVGEYHQHGSKTHTADKECLQSL